MSTHVNNARQYPIPLGSLIRCCPRCGARVCDVPASAAKNARVVTVDYSRGENFEAWGAEHDCKGMSPHASAKSGSNAEPKSPDGQDMKWLEQGLSWCCGAPFDESHVIQAKGRLNGHGPRLCSQCRKVLFRV